MSLVSDIIQFIGPTSVPVVVAGTVLFVFELGEKLASQRAKDALSKWLVSFDVQKAKALPDGTQELFERVFGERHFSLKCFFRSAVFSLGAMVFIGILTVLIYARGVESLKREIFLTYLSSDVYRLWFEISFWLLWNILIGYVSLFKTRIVLRILTRLRIRMLSVGILVLDFVVYKILFLVGLRFFSIVGEDHELIWIDTAIFDIPSIGNDVSLLPGFIWFWAGFAPSIWMWLYVLALFVTRGLLRSERIVNWLRWFLDVEKTPFRSIGAVAAALAFIASIAIILVSAEVSRLSAAA